MPFEIYKLYTDRLNQVSSRRQTTNSFMLAINAALIGVVGGAVDDAWARAALSLLIVALNVSWLWLIHSYHLLDGVRYHVITSMEIKLFDFRPYFAEIKGVGGDTKKPLFTPLHKIERLVALALAGVGLTLLVTAIVDL